MTNLGDECSICGHTNIVYSGKALHYRHHVAQGEAVELYRDDRVTPSRVFLAVSATGAIESLLGLGFKQVP